MEIQSNHKQPVVVRLPADLVRRVKAVTGASAAYEDLAELVELALLNQLELDEGASRPRRTAATTATPGPTPGDDESDTEVSALLCVPSGEPNTIDRPLDSDTSPLSPFTNRLFPVKLCCRVLANLPGSDLAEFQRSAARAARALGLRLRREDAEARRHSLDRRWVALPVGRKGTATMNRFINHFSLTLTRAGDPSGPMAVLGLCGLLEGNRPTLTEVGADLASAPSPVLDGDTASGGVLGEEERRLMLAAIAANAAESEAILRFAEIVEGNAGIQERVDAAIPAQFGTTSPAQATTLRAAMVGRLHDLGLLELGGAGPGVQIRIDIDPLIGLRGEEQQ